MVRLANIVPSFGLLKHCDGERPRSLLVSGGRGCYTGRWRRPASSSGGRIMQPAHRPCSFGFLLLLLTCPVRAGLHYSGEEYNPLPAQWRGFLLDQRHLRLLAIAPGPKAPVSAFRVRYEKALAELEKAA